MNKLFNDREGYLSAMGAIIALILVTTVMFFMFNIHKKQQSSIMAFKESLIDNKMNDRIALERISGLYHNDLLFDLKDNDLIKGNILSFDDINKKFKIIDVSNDFGVKPREVVLKSLDPELTFSLNNNTDLTIETTLTQHYERLIDDQVDRDYGSYQVDVEYEEKPIFPKDKDYHFISKDESYHRIIFKEDEIKTGDYTVKRTNPGVYSDYSVYSGKERVEMRIEYTEVNRLVKIIDLDNDDNEGKIYYVKLENNSSLNKNDEKTQEDNILVYLLNEKDLDRLMTDNK